MRFVTWNLCAGDTEAKVARFGTPPDVAVLCEVSKTAPIASPYRSSPEWLWEGELVDRGIAIASWTTEMIRVVPSEESTQGRFSVAAHLANGMGVVGLWACPPKTGRSYGAEIHSTIDAYEEMLCTRPCLLAGDFNITPGGSADHRNGVTKRLDQLGYVSAYHAFHGVDFGDEQPTYYHQFKNEQPFHIDMVFVPKHLTTAIRSVEIAPLDGWVTAGRLRSDHVPVSVEFDLDSLP